MCVQAGLTPFEFWELSWFELDAVIEGYNVKAKNEAELLISTRENAVINRNLTAAFYNANKGKGGKKYKDKDVILFSWEQQADKELKDKDPVKWVQEKRMTGAEKAKAFRERWNNKKTKVIPL